MSGLDAAFLLVEKSKALEKQGKWSLAKEELCRAVAIFEQIVVVQTDYRSRTLLAEHICGFRKKIARLDADAAFDTALKFDEQKDGNIAQIEAAYYSAGEKYLAVLQLCGDDEAVQKRRKFAQERIQDLKSEKRAPPAPPGRPVASPAVPVLPPAPLGINSIVTPLPPAQSAPHTSPAMVSPPVAPLVVPLASPELSASKFTAAEMAVLKNSSTINGKIYQPWLDGEENREKFRYTPPYSEDLLPLSEEQQRLGAQWKRPRELIAPPQPSSSAEHAQKPIVVIKNIDPLSVTQDLVSDCSFVCSLCVAAEYEKRFKKRLITKIIYPQNNEGVPIYNAYGKYLVKLHLNGVPRKVVVDDRLPVDASGRLLCSSGERTEGSIELWVSIIEKAYMKVNGGYDFPGSNSGIDLYALTGWIPEHVFFEDDNRATSTNLTASLDHRQSEDRAWARIKSATSYGDCLVTISTAPVALPGSTGLDEFGRLVGLTTADEESTGLVPNHAYAVLDVKEIGSLRLLKVKNPWSRRSWKGRYSCSDTGSWTPVLRAALGISETEFSNLSAKGIFWIEYSDCRKYFKGFFLNWNPKLFSYRYVIHHTWPMSQGPKNDNYYYGDNPQFTLAVHDPLATAMSLSQKGENKNNVFLSAKKSVWILLSRHIVRSETESDQDSADFMTVHIYKGRGERVYRGVATPFVKGVYTSDPHCLCRFDIESDRTTEWHYYTLVLSQIEKKRDISFSLSVFSTAAFKLSETPPLYPCQVDVSGQWSLESSSNGGPPSSVAYYRNPQYRLDVRSVSRQTLPIHLQARFPKEVSGNISVVRSSKNDESTGPAARIDALFEGDAVLASGDYSPGFCCVDGNLAAGSYTVVLSAYSTSMVGPLRLLVAAPTPDFKVTELLSEGSGMTKSTVSGQWNEDDNTNAGCSNFGKYEFNPTYVFKTEQKILISARLVMTQGFMTIPPKNSMNISLHRISESDYNCVVNGTPAGHHCINPAATSKNAFASSNGGVYSDRNCGVAIPKTELDAGCFWAFVPSTFEPTIATFEIIIYSSQPLKIMPQKKTR